MKAASILVAGLAIVIGTTGAWAQGAAPAGTGSGPVTKPAPSPASVSPWRVIPFSLSSRRITELDLRLDRPLAVRMTAVPTRMADMAQVFVSLRGPTGRILANRHGRLPLSLAYRVSAADLSRGTRWRIEMLSTGSVRGRLKLWLGGVQAQPSAGVVSKANPQPRPAPAQRMVFSLSRTMKLERGVSIVLDVPPERAGRILVRARATSQSRGRRLRLEVRRWDGRVLARKVGVLPLALDVVVSAQEVHAGRPWTVRLRNLHRRPVRAELTAELMAAPEAVPSS